MSLEKFQLYCIKSKGRLRREISQFLRKKTRFRHNQNKHKDISVQLISSDYHISSDYPEVPSNSNDCEQLLRELNYLLLRLEKCDTYVDYAKKCLSSIPVSNFLKSSATSIRPQNIVSPVIKEEWLVENREELSNEIGSYLDMIDLNENNGTSIDLDMFITEENFKDVLQKCTVANEYEFGERLHSDAWLTGQEQGSVDFGYLGCHMDGKVLLDVARIYACAKRNSFDEKILFEKVFVHELAHAMHCKGRDADDEPWKNWLFSSKLWKDKKERTNIVEGLAQWYTFEYALTKNIQSKGKDRLLPTLLLLSKKQAPEYSIFIKWIKHKPEVIRKAIMSARRMPPNKQLDLVKFQNFF